MYYVTRIQQTSDGKEVRNITPLETIDEAEVQFHKVLAADIDNEKILSTSVMVFDHTNSVYMSKYWQAKVEA